MLGFHNTLNRQTFEENLNNAVLHSPAFWGNFAK